MIDRKKLLEALGPFLGLAFIFLLFTVLAGTKFCNLSNVTLVAVQTVVVGLGAMGMTLIIISGGIDLSVGSVIALSTVVTALGLDQGFPVPIAVGLGVFSGAACGCVSGLLITSIRIVPFIATPSIPIAIHGRSASIDMETQNTAETEKPAIRTTRIP